MNFMTLFIVLLCIFLFFFGAAVYSFLNVVIFRVPRGEEFVKTRSHCPGCGRILTPMELIPVVSYVCLGGKCKNCGSKIGLRDVSIEVFGGLSAIAALAYSYYGAMKGWLEFSLLEKWMGLESLINAGQFEEADMIALYGVLLHGLAIFSVIGILTIICFINMDTDKVHRGTLIALGVAGVYAVLAFPEIALVSRLIGAACAAGFYLIMGALLGRKDLVSGMIIAAIAGLMLGGRAGVSIVAVGIILTAVTAIILLLTGNRKLDRRLKTIPILCITILIGIFAGNWIADLFIP